MTGRNERRKKHFIAVLGTGGYTPCTYYLDENTCDTKFVQEAVLKLACGELRSDDRITICLTEDARRQNWEDRAYNQREIERNSNLSQEIYQGLHAALEASLKHVAGIQIEEKDIATGKDSREIARMFSEIYDVIDEGEEIYFDITHGLRNIPMLVMAILEYAKVTKGILIGGIYYGAFEVGIFDPALNRKRVPIYDMTFYHTIMNWSNAANSFIQYGHADEISELVNERWQSIARTSSKSQNVKELSGNLNNVAKRLQEFTSGIETGRGNTEYKKSIQKCYDAYKSQQKFTSEYLVEEYYPFRELLDKIERKTEKYKNAKTNLEVGMATIDWCIENHMVQQGYTALDETVKTFLCEKIGVSQEEEFWREMIVKRICTSLYSVIEGTCEEMEYQFEEWQKFLRARGQCDEEKKKKAFEKGRELYVMITGIEKHKKLIPLMNRIGTKRNDISHFGFTDHTAAPDSLKKELKSMADTFCEIQREWDIP